MDILDTLNTLDIFDTLDSLDTLYTVDIFDILGTLNTLDIMDILMKPHLASLKQRQQAQRKLNQHLASLNQRQQAQRKEGKSGASSRGNMNVQKLLYKPPKSPIYEKVDKCRGTDFSYTDCSNDLTLLVFKGLFAPSIVGDLVICKEVLHLHIWVTFVLCKAGCRTFLYG